MKDILAFLFLLIPAMIIYFIFWLCNGPNPIPWNWNGADGMIQLFFGLLEMLAMIGAFGVFIFYKADNDKKK